MSITYAQKQSPAQKKDANTAASVVDCSSQGEALQRKANMANNAAQRMVQKTGDVVQRVGEANEVFEYYPDISGEAYKNRVPYKPEKICFTPYTGGEVKSAGFCGCYMMAFYFVGFDENMLSKDSADFEPDYGIPYIAHVAMNGESLKTRNAFADAENRDLIKVVALFRPTWNPVSEMENLQISKEALKKLNKNKMTKDMDDVNKKTIVGLCAFTAGLEQNDDMQWVAKKYSQEKQFNSVKEQNVSTLNFRWKNELLDEKSADLMKTETLVSRIYLYLEAKKVYKLKMSVFEIYDALFEAQSLVPSEDQHIINYWLPIVSMAKKAILACKADTEENSNYLEGFFSAMDQQDDLREFVCLGYDGELERLRTKYYFTKLPNV